MIIIVTKNEMEKVGEKALDKFIHHEEKERYIDKNGWHFNEKLEAFARKHMKNIDGTEHSWTMKTLKEDLAKYSIPEPEAKCMYDLLYLANWLYSDWYPESMSTVPQILKGAKKILKDPDGYNGMILKRWCRDLKEKGVEIPWDEMA